MLNAVKWFTQRITLMIVIPIFLVIPWLFTQLGQALGVWGSIDGYGTGSTQPLWWDRPLFWLAVMASRILFTVGWFYLGFWITEKAEKAGFFWFKPHSSLWSQTTEIEPRDWTYRLFRWFMYIIALTAFGEIVIRFLTWTVPPYVVK